ncbi:PREDICTED: uncharacterized protein LOC109462411, partial [Paramuricea clavata]
MEKSNMISLSGDNDIKCIGDNITINKHCPCTEKCHVGQVISGPRSTAPVSNCYEPVHKYWSRKELDDEIKKIQKGKLKILHGSIGTGKTSAALRHIFVNKQKFAISWVIDVSTGEDSIIESLTDLAEKLGISYGELFHTIEQKAENEDIMFLLDNVGTNPSNCDWFKSLWSIRRSIYIIITTNYPSLDFPDAEQLWVEKFEEALDFLEGIHAENCEEDLKELCDHFGWNILGLTAAKQYMLKNKIPALKYLEMQHNRLAAQKVRLAELSNRDRILYESVCACLEEVDSDKFRAIAATSLISNKMIPEFFLSNLLSSNDLLANVADLNVLHDELKSLVRITEENGIRFFSFHSFTQYVIRDIIAISLKNDLLYKLAGIFMKYVSKDNRFSKGDFLQRTVREHAEIFLREWENKQKDDRSLIALARLSELVGFTYTQQQPPSQHKLDVHFIRARNLLHELCGITEEDLQPDDSLLCSLLGLCWGSLLEDSMYGITRTDSAVARKLFTKLTKKSSELSPEIINELVFLRTVNKQDFALFPEVVKETQTVKKTVESSYPLSPNDVKVLVDHGAAYSVDRYRELFLPELYLSVIYSFGRNYFYRDRATAENLSFYIDLLKLAYCLSHEISKQMNHNEHVLHEFSVQANGLLYLLVNDDYISQDGTRKKKNAQAHAKDLKNAIDRYKQFIDDERTFFEMGILKRTKDDTYGKLVCYQQILRCYKNLLSLKNIDRDQYIEDGVQLCDELLQLLDKIATKDIGRKKEDLVRYCKHMNAVAEFYIFINREEHYSSAIKIFTISAEHAEKYDMTFFYLEALVGLADIFSRIGKHRFSATQVSIRHLKRCNSKESLLEMQGQKRHIQERISRIQRQNVAMILKHCIRILRRRKRDETSQRYVDESDACEVQVDSASSTSSANVSHDEIEDDEIENSSTLMEERNEELPRSNGTFQHPSSSALPGNSSQHPFPETNQDHMNADTECQKPQDKYMDNHLLKLAQNIPGDWKELAKFLGISDSKIKEIRLNNLADVVWQAYMMLKHWWTSRHQAAQSWREELRKALCEIDRQDLAQDFTGDVLQTDT